jgi:DNA recombination-dependent growth factor C
MQGTPAGLAISSSTFTENWFQTKKGNYMRNFRTSYQKLKGASCLDCNLSISAYEAIDPANVLDVFIGASLYGYIAAPSIPEKDCEYLARNIVLGTARGEKEKLIPGRVIQRETQQKKVESFENGKNFDRTLDKDAAYSLKGPKAEERSVRCKKQGNRYFEGHSKHIVTVQSMWKAP